MLYGRVKTRMIEPDEALAGRAEPTYAVPTLHAVLGTPIAGPVPAGYEEIFFGLGCFWGAERKFWQVPGVWTTAVGYQGGYTPNPTYDEVCTGRTAHTEAVRVVFDPAKVSLEDLLEVFWTIHDPTQGFRQANDVGTQYRSAVYWTTPEQREVVERTRATYQKAIDGYGYGTITTEVAPAAERPFYYAEDYHQQYLYKNPHGYDCHSSTGVPYPSE
ncbi:MAG TPA: peptide-methionine (S)-S-oxide reductase MsrA [Actinomycetes bacterium]|nr:peptide-methionine (S)-S-oxide reductase MsrA [Actinomycetes bacterium]